MDFSQMRKAFVPLAVMIIIAALGSVGITGQMSVSDAINLIVTGIVSAIGVYFVPNKK